MLQIFVVRRLDAIPFQNICQILYWMNLTPTYDRFEPKISQIQHFSPRRRPLAADWQAAARKDLGLGRKGSSYNPKRNQETPFLLIPRLRFLKLHDFVSSPHFRSIILLKLKTAVA